MRAIVAWFAVVLALPAAADDVPNREANRLFEAGRAQIKAGNFDAGCALLEQSYELERAPGTQLNLGECDEHAGKLRSAWLLYDAAAREYERTDRPKQASFARRRADAVAPRLAAVVVRIATPNLPGLTVRIGDHTIAASSRIVDRVVPATVEIEVKAPGRIAFATTVEAELGSEVTVDVPVLAREGAARPSRSSNPWRPAVYAGVTLTTLSLVTFGASYAALAAVGHGEKCAPQGQPQTQFACEHGDLIASAGNVAFYAVLAGAAFTGVAIYQARKRDAANRSLLVVPAVSAELTGIILDATW